MNIHIDPAAVTRAGDDLLAQTADAKDRISLLFELTSAAISAHRGWDTAGALDGCRLAWHARLNELVDETASQAANIIESATAVSTGDAEAAARLGNVLDELAGP